MVRDLEDLKQALKELDRQLDQIETEYTDKKDSKAVCPYCHRKLPTHKKQVLDFCINCNLELYFYQEKSSGKILYTTGNFNNR